MAETSGPSGSNDRRFTVRPPREVAKPAAPVPMPVAYRKRGGFLSQVSGFLTFLLIAGVIGYLSLGFLRDVVSQPGPIAEERSVVIPRGSGMSDAAKILQQQGLIEDEWWFRLAAQLRGGKLQAGEFMIPKNASLLAVVDTLVVGKRIDRRITIPEGLTSQQIVQRVKDVDFLVGDIGAIPVEGSLLPDTYQVERGTSRDAFIARMQKAQRQVLDKIWASRRENLPLRSPEELVILASIVEKETGQAEERPRVAGVYINRLRTLTGDFINADGKKEPPMTLDSDPSVIYGISKGAGRMDRPLLRSDLQDTSNPYNTYRMRGLPPGPIANPGRAAMEAVADPLPTQELYFVADGTGGHVFANSLKEHNRNVAEWRKIQARMEKEAAEKANTPLPASETPTVDEKPIDKQGSDENLKQRLQQNGLMLVPVEADSWPDGLMQLAQAMEPPMAADQFDGVASFPVPERMRKKKTGQPAKLDGTVNPGMADNPEATVPPGELGPTVSQQAGAAPIKRRRRAIDASEGKKIDPLLRKNYDLNSTQLVPAL